MATGNVPITAGTGTPIRIVTNAGVDSGANQQVMSLANSDGSLLPFDPDGTLQVANDPTSLLLDDFSGTLATNFTTGGTAPTITGGALQTSEGVTVSATSYVRSNLTYALRAASFLRIAHMVAIEAAATANNTRWWGYGQNAATPSATAPVTNGAVFLLDSANAGAMEAVIYSGGVKTIVATLTRPSDATVHRYEVTYRQSIIYWLIDGATVATRTYPNLAVATNMYAIVGAANTATAPAAHTFQISSVSISDTGRNNMNISDGVNPNLMATVRPTMENATAIPPTSDSALVVHNYPTASLASTVLGTAATAATLTLTAPGAGYRHYITGIWIERFITAATTAAATAVASGGANHGIVFSLPNDARTLGQLDYPVAVNFNSPIPTTAQNTATTFTTPAVTGTQYRITVTYFIAA